MDLHTIDLNKLHAFLAEVRTGRAELSDTVWLDELAAAADGRGARALREAVVEEIAAAR